MNHEPAVTHVVKKAAGIMGYGQQVEGVDPSRLLYPCEDASGEFCPILGSSVQER